MAIDSTTCEPAQRSNRHHRIEPVRIASRVPLAHRSAFLALSQWGALLLRLAPETGPERVAAEGLLRALASYADWAHRANLEPALWTTCLMWQNKLIACA